MSALSLQITYRRGKLFAAYIDLDAPGGEKVARTEEIRPEVLVDYSARGRPLGIEILSPEQVELSDIYAVFDRLGIPRPPEHELAPLRAA